MPAPPHPLLTAEALQAIYDHARRDYPKECCGIAYGPRDLPSADQATAWQATTAAAALYVTCVGRGRGFYGVSGLESAYLRQHLGALPVAGFFSSAEYAPGAVGTRLHQYTGVLTMLGAGT